MIKVVQFIQNCGPSMKGEVVSVNDHAADVPTPAGIRALAKEFDRKPDQLVPDKVDENGRLATIETRIVPDDSHRPSQVTVSLTKPL